MNHRRLVGRRPWDRHRAHGAGAGWRGQRGGQAQDLAYRAEPGRCRAAALAGCPAGTRLEVVIEPTGAAWLPIAVFFSARGHQVFRVSSQKAADLRRFLSRHAKSNGIDADTLARLPLLHPAGLRPLQLPGAGRAALDRRVRATDRLTRAAADHKRRIKDLVRQLLPMTPLTGDLGVADLAVLERYADPRALAQAGAGPADRADHQGLPRPSRRRPRPPVAGGRPHVACALRRPPRRGLRRPGRRSRSPRSSCCALSRPSSPPTPASAKPATRPWTQPGSPARCPGWPRSAARR